MSLRKTIFIRTAVLLGTLIFLCNLAMAMFVIRQNRKAWKGFGMSEAVFIAGQAERLLLWDDRVAMRDLFASRKNLNRQIEQIFMETGSAPYAHTFPAGVPAGLLGFRGWVPGNAAQREVRDGRGRVYYDIAAQVKGTDSVVHLLISRNKVDMEVLAPTAFISGICILGWLISLLPAWHIACAVTREVDMSTRALNELNEELETRIEDRTSQLAASNTMLTKEIAEKEKLEKEKEDFFAMVTHDLKSPIAVIAGYADLIREIDPGMKSDAAEMLGHIRQSAEKLSSIVGEFLTVSRFERGKLMLNMSPCDIAGIVREVAEEYTLKCEGRGVTMTSDLDGDIPTVMLDRTYIQRALSNLVQNAVNFTSDGGRVSIRVRRTGESGSLVMVSVTDTGIGIPHEEKDRVFEKYYRSSLSSGIKGTGLGLAVVKAVATAHGGSVELQSEVGKGSTFSMILPLSEQQIIPETMMENM